MIKLSEKFSKLNIDQKLLFLATLLIPFLVFAVYINLIFNEIYTVVSEYLNPPKFYISNCWYGFIPFYLTILGFSSLFTLSVSSFYIIVRNLSKSLIFLGISVFITYFFLFGRCYYFSQNTRGTLLDYLLNSIDLITYTFYISILLIWQISAFSRYKTIKLS